MKSYFLTFLLFCCMSANAQNQVVRRQGAKKEPKALTTSKKTTKTQGATAKRATSSPKKQTSHRINASYSYGVLKVNGVRYEMVKVNAGTFTMGATSEMKDPYDDERPTHQVTLTNNYYMGKTEVTQALWKAVMGSNPSSFKGDNKPVENVSWNDCQTFIKKLNQATGKNFRLPTEAEWEFAARGGNNSKHYQYSGSNNIDDVAWDTDDSDGTHDVATKSPNELGLYDMSGNVSEWCQDVYGNYSSSAQTDPKGPTGESFRVLRDVWDYRSSIRFSHGPRFRCFWLGFRLALSK